MCLVSEVKEPLTSTNEIICYKVLIPVGNKLFTPYRDFLFPVNEVVVDKADERVLEFSNNFFIIETGYFHSYKDLDTAKEVVDILKKKLSKEIKIYKAIIPSNTKYYEGQFKDICSKALKIICDD